MSPSLKPVERPTDAITAVKAPSVAVSVVVPVTERYDDLAEIYQAHAAVLNRTGRSFEFIFILDAGYEEAARKLEQMQTSGEPIRVLNLPRNFGEATALTVGFKQARGDVLLTLSAYFQVKPEGIQKVLSLLDEGYDLVLTRRYPRIDSWINRLQNYGFHLLTRWLTGVQFHDISCGLRGMRRQVARGTHLYGDLHRFLPLLAYQRGFRVAEVLVPQHPLDGRMRVYRPGVYLRRLLDILTLVFLFKFTKKPLRFFGLIGVGLFGGGFLISLVLAIERVLGLTALADRPLLILGVLLMVLGVQIGSIGLLGELIIFTHAREMEDYTIERVLRTDCFTRDA